MCCSAEMMCVYFEFRIPSTHVASLEPVIPSALNITRACDSISTPSSVSLEPVIPSAHQVGHHLSSLTGIITV